MAVSFNIRRAVVPNPRNENRFEDDYDPNRGMHGDAFQGHNAQADPLGIDASQRAQQHQQNYRARQHSGYFEPGFLHGRESRWQAPLEELANANNPRWKLGPKMIQSVPTDKKWDAYFQVLQSKGVDKLAADAVTPGGSPSFFGDQFGHGGATAPAGYTQQRAMDELKKFQVTGQPPGFATTPGGSLAQLTPGQSKYVQNILDGLREGMPRYRHYGYK